MGFLGSWGFLGKHGRATADPWPYRPTWHQTIARGRPLRDGWPTLWASESLRTSLRVGPMAIRDGHFFLIRTGGDGGKAAVRFMACFLVSSPTRANRRFCPIILDS